MQWIRAKLIVVEGRRNSGTDPPGSLQIWPTRLCGEQRIFWASIFGIVQQNILIAKLDWVGEELGDIVDCNFSCSHGTKLLLFQLLLLLFRRKADVASSLYLVGFFENIFAWFLGSALNLSDLKSAFFGHVLWRLVRFDPVQIAVRSRWNVGTEEIVLKNFFKSNTFPTPFLGVKMVDLFISRQVLLIISFQKM